MTRGLKKGQKKQTKEERAAKKKESDRKYGQTPKRRAARLERSRRPDVKAKGKEYRERPEVKARIKELDQRPEVLAKKRAYSRIPYVKAKRQERALRPDVKAKKVESLAKNRLKVLESYSKILSKSNIPCCNCCGENFHVEFLAVDHIAGKYKMDSEPELVKLGYTSKILGDKLINWLIKNEFPKGFQILCHNCNYAKGIRRNKNTCPHEIERKEETFAMMEEQSSFEV